MIARNHKLMADCKLMRFWLLAVEAAEYHDPAITPYVQAAMKKALIKAGVVAKEGLFCDFVLLPGWVLVDNDLKRVARAASQ